MPRMLSAYGTKHRTMQAAEKDTGATPLFIAHHAFVLLLKGGSFTATITNGSACITSSTFSRKDLKDPMLPHAPAQVLQA